MECNFKHSSSIISDWVQKKRISMFDFDNCHFNKDSHHYKILSDFV